MLGRTALALATTLVVAGTLAATPAGAHGRGANVSHLEVDGRGDNPLGVDDPAPRLSWRVKTASDGWHQAAGFHTLAWILTGFVTASALLGLFFAPSNAGKSLQQIEEEQTGEQRFVRTEPASTR